MSVALARRRRLSPSFARLTFAGPGVEHVADHGLDQRVKLVLPLSSGEAGLLPGPEPWFDAWRVLPQARRNPLRTYTLRAVRARDLEVDTRCCTAAMAASTPVWPAAGQQRAGPVRRARATSSRWCCPTPATPARPAASTSARRPVRTACCWSATRAPCRPSRASLERLPATARGEVAVEVPHAGDVLPLDGPPGMPVTCLARGAAPRGSLFAPAVHAAAARVASPTTYAWMAGESGVVTRLRRRLVAHDGWDRGRVTFRGCWREGVAEG